jgi:tetratricopeptide (TPR) repeat protein
MLSVSNPVGRWVVGFVVATGVFYPIAVARLKFWTYRLARGGQFDKALRLNRAWRQFIPLYGESLEGSILFNAGRYPEARELLMPLAFDQFGNPLIESTALYTYTLALTNDGLAAEARPLLEAAVDGPRPRSSFQVALAGCLLTLDKEPERARALMEQVLASEPVPEYGKNADQARRLARYAWALAGCGKREEAEAQINAAFAGAFSLKASDRAGLQYFAGQAWRVLGEKEKSRAAFHEAIALSPDGSTAMSARTGLAKLDEKD